jgi:hypothetical protein
MDATTALLLSTLFPALHFYPLITRYKLVVDIAFQSVLQVTTVDVGIFLARAQMGI